MKDITDDLLDRPEYFYCEKTRCKLKVEICIGRQKANEQKGAFEGVPYGVCLDCEQGAENKASCIVEENIQGKPRRGKGVRYQRCEAYSKCLDAVTRREWKSFNCESCEIFKEISGLTETEKEQEGERRICEDCGEKPTIWPTTPYCPSCMAKRSNSKARKKKDEALNSEREVKGRGRGRPRTRRLDLISKPDHGRTTSPGQKNVVVVDFSNHPTILQEVERLAKEDIRPLGLQILYMLKKRLEEAITTERP